MPSTNRDDQTNAGDDPTRRRHRRPRRNRLPIPQRQVDYWRELAGPPATDTARHSTEDVPVLDGEQGVCGNCHRQGHKVIDCWRPRKDGLIHGCGVCNSSVHPTRKCSQFPTQIGDQVELLVNKRARLPPLATPDWYPILYEFMHGAVQVPPPDRLPWSEEYSKSQASDESTLDYLQHNLRENEAFIDRNVSDWAAAQNYFEGMPPVYKMALLAEEGLTELSHYRPSLSYGRDFTNLERETILVAKRVVMKDLQRS
ncbi:hypothetical protein EDB81DRAFT_891201 [Dactylonectria macrodidyma]|uniref:CCHC-type domain-containing protein n=1 Tax=Dactylonectria macrodidyma TaxID=307937 RepID=A0A9P9DLT9_9HYPO|nr:hypothetical protein EDB81DRAFT_891201 [Dactylonectria macrodidyma]